MEIQDQLSNVHNLQSVVHDYFEELMALNSIIYNTDIVKLEMIENNGILITNIEFKSHEDCNTIHILTRSNYVIRYGVKINISSSMQSKTRLTVLSVKD